MLYSKFFPGMVLFFLMAVVLALALAVARPAQADGSLSPLTWECLVEASEKFDVPLAMLVSIMAAESGEVGRISKNTNGTYDIGPMQINSIWLPILRQVGITETELCNNGCVNVAVAAWLLRSHIAASKTPQEAIATYHSKTPDHAAKYLNKVQDKARTLNVETVLAKANKTIAKNKD